MSEDVERDMAAEVEALRQIGQIQRQKQQWIWRQEQQPQAQRVRAGKFRRAAERAARNKEAGQNALTKWYEVWGPKLWEESRQKAKKKRGRHADPSRTEIDYNTERAVLLAFEKAQAQHPKISVRELSKVAYEFYEEFRASQDLPALGGPDGQSLRTRYYQIKKKDKSGLTENANVRW
jgi:hypothetical protein